MNTFQIYAKKLKIICFSKFVKLHEFKKEEESQWMFSYKHFCYCPLECFSEEY